LLSPRRWPYLTVTILVVTVIAQIENAVIPLYSLSRSSTGGLILALFLHPFVHHMDPWHLWGDLVLGFLVMGILIESWVALSWKYRYAMYGLAYVSSLVACVLTWQWIGFTHNIIIGLSGIISGGFGVLVLYCWIVRKSLRVDRRDAPALIALGYLLSFLVSSVVNAFTHMQDPGAADSAIYHVLAFFCGFYLGRWLFRDPKVRNTLLQTRSRPSDTSNCTSHLD